MIDTKRLEEMLKVFQEELKVDNVHTRISTQENTDTLKLARIGLYWQECVESENGKANVLYLLELGRWARDIGVPSMIRTGVRRAQTIFIEDEKHVEHFFEDMKTALAVLPKDTQK